MQYRAEFGHPPVQLSCLRRRVLFAARLVGGVSQPQLGDAGQGVPGMGLGEAA